MYKNYNKFNNTVRSYDIFQYGSYHIFQTVQRLGKDWKPGPNELFEDLIFSCGSVVWAKQGKFVMWPGMIDFCPDNNTFTWADKVCRF